MNVQITKEKLLTDLDKLNTITELPNLYWVEIYLPVKISRHIIWAYII